MAVTGEAVVLVHGLWMGRWVMGYLERRLEEAGYLCFPFGYHTTSVSFAANIERLRRFLAGIQAERLHVVAHSMGGLLSLESLRDDRGLPSGRVVLLGSPLRGSRVARRLGGWGWGRRLLRESYRPLSGGIAPWDGAREVGAIAGNFNLGPGLLFQRPGSIVADGTVQLEETLLHGLTEHTVLPASHTAMLAQRRTAELVVRFLARGTFREGER